MVGASTAFAGDYTFTPDGTTSGSTSTRYVTTETEFTYNNIGWAFYYWNPSSMQVKTNESSKTGEFYFYNTTAFSGNITKVVLTFSSLTLKSTSASGWYLTPGVKKVGTSSLSTEGSVQGVWDATAKTLTFDVTGDAVFFTVWQNGKVASGSNYLAKSDAIKVTYTADSRTATTTTFDNESYTFDLNSTEAKKFDGQKATVKAGDTEVKDAAVKYTIETDDENFVTIEEATGVVALDETRTGKATVTATYAGDDTYKGSTASYTITIVDPNKGEGTAEKPYSVAEASAIIAAGTETTDAVYVKGIVSQIDEVSTDYGNATYYISDDGTTTDQLEVYRGKFLANAKFTDEKQLEVGDKVLVNGTLINYNSKTPEIKSSQLSTLATPVKVSASGYATLYYSAKSFTIPAGVEAYTYTVSDGKLAKAAVSTTIPAGEAVVLKAAEGTYDFAVTTAEATAATDNDLLGSDEETTPDADANSYFYKVSYDATGKNLGFYWGAEDGGAFTNGAHKAYLKAPKTAASAKGWAFDGTATAISLPTQTAKDDAVRYNLAGQRVGKSYRGMVIMNGKKVIVK